MEQRNNRPVEFSVSALPGAAAAALAWSQGGRLYVTVIAKATFSFAQDTMMPRTAPEEILRRDVHHGPSPATSLRAGSDLAPWLLRADVVLTGHARVPAIATPPGTALPIMPVRLGVFDGARRLLDKTVIVHDEDGVDGTPLVYERAVCGAGDEQNPFGAGADSAGKAPSLFHPTDESRPAGFGPIGRAWPARRRLLGATPRKRLDAPVPDIPADFDWRYYQTAPADQQIGYLRGDEWIVIDGVSTERGRVRARLPGARGLARVYGLADMGADGWQLLVLRADTLRIDADAGQCTVVWRNRFAVPNEDALGALHIDAGVELPDEAIVWPEPPLEMNPDWLVDTAPAPLPAVALSPLCPPAYAEPFSVGVARA